MADITMCMNNKCPQADNCWRYCAPPEKFRQSYAEFQPDNEGECLDFYPFPDNVVFPTLNH